MELTVGQVAEQSGRTPRLVRRAMASGRLPVSRVVGRQSLVDDIAMTSWLRATAHGPQWRPRGREAALDLLSEGTTSALAGPELSRLKRTLRQATAATVAHAAGGLGGAWSRYRAIPSGGRIGPSSNTARELGVIDGTPWVTFVETPDLDAWELAHDAILDADGDVGVVERPTGDTRSARALLDCYLLGDARVSAAAAALIEERAHAV